MVKKNVLGVKRICQECGVKFYDLNKDVIVCPKCEASFKLEDIKKAKLNPTFQKEDAEIIEIEENVGAEDENVLEDTSDLEDDNLSNISVEE